MSAPGWRPFNVNSEVRVKLTPLGREIHRRNFDAIAIKLPGRTDGQTWPEYRAPEEDAEGWSTWQLWDLMHEFGLHLHNGCDLPFSPNIEFTTKPLV